MASEEKVAKVKQDLRHLRKITHSIEVALQVKERHEKRLEVLRQAKQTAEVEEEIKKIERVLSSLHIEDSIKKATALEFIYTDAIDRLEPLDKAIVLDCYINGNAYWKAGRGIGYSADGIRKKADKAIRKLADMV